MLNSSLIAPACWKSQATRELSTNACEPERRSYRVCASTPPTTVTVMRHLAITAVIIASGLAAGCSSTAEPQRGDRPDPTPSSESAPAAPAATTTATAAAPAPPRPSSEPSAQAACTDDCVYSAEEGSYLIQTTSQLQPRWFETYSYLEHTGQSQMWLDMGYAVCGLYEAGWDRGQVVDFLAPNYTNPGLYSDGFAEALADAAAATICV